MSDNPEPVSIPIDLKVPAVLTNPVGGEAPKPKRRATTILEVDAALSKHTTTVGGTNRKAAAEELGVSLKSLENRIAKNPFLLSRWGRNATAQHLRDEMIKIGTKDEEIDFAGILHRSIDVQMMGDAEMTKRVLKQIADIENQIALHQEAFAMPDTDPRYKETRRHLFTYNDKGEPSQERLVRETLGNLYEQYRKLIELGVQANYTKARIMGELRKGAATGGRPTGANRPKGLGMAPKGSRPVMAATPLVDARGGNVLVQVTNGSQNGNPRAEAAGSAADLRPAPTNGTSAPPPE